MRHERAYRLIMLTTMMLLTSIIGMLSGCGPGEINYFDGSERIYIIHEGEVYEAPYDGYMISLPEYLKIMKGQ